MSFSLYDNMFQGRSITVPQTAVMTLMKGFCEMYLLLWNRIKRIKNQVYWRKLYQPDASRAGSFQYLKTYPDTGNDPVVSGLFTNDTWRESEF